MNIYCTYFYTYVISYRYKTTIYLFDMDTVFYTYVISYRYKTHFNLNKAIKGFYTYVISYRYKTSNYIKHIKFYTYYYIVHSYLFFKIVYLSRW